MQSSLTHHMLVSENNTRIDASPAARSRPGVCPSGVCTCASVCFVGAGI